MRGNDRKQKGLSLGEIRDIAAAFPRAAVTGPAAARLMGLPTLQWVEAVDLRYLSGAKPGKQPKDPRVVYRGGSMRQDLVQERNGVLTAHPIQVLFDIYRYYGRLDALVPIEHLRFHNRVCQEALLDSARSLLPRANGIRGFEGLVGWSAGTSQSALETIGRDTVLRADIPEAHTFEFQVEVVFEDIFAQQRFASVDMMINGWLAVEFDGRIKSDGTYGDGVKVLLAQLDRQHEIQALGFSVVRAGWRDVVSGKLVRDLRRLLRARREAA
ncbi:hypothetical protein CJ203_00305 [Corynebacterium tuscaniense]|uniref:AbiEi antitoxin C-terminal domain-containing protein n=1 Tax=Corynebacterium tuscaniense TaxID=302449 RepID=A0A2N6T7S7_9CORY|nr:hypothetical protein [Corynebacterium tuscaniense]PMC65365.1 hypothetical protein CJ203_00305 [Corynebacterium tuscaniense]